jgi:hypothetical protein
MHQTRKGKQWYFGMKVHIGADVDSGAVHGVAVTGANEADINVLPRLLRKQDEVIFGDAGYTSDLDMAKSADGNTGNDSETLSQGLQEEQAVDLGRVSQQCGYQIRDSPAATAGQERDEKFLC